MPGGVRGCCVCAGGSTRVSKRPRAPPRLCRAWGSAMGSGARRRSESLGQVAGTPRRLPAGSRFKIDREKIQFSSLSALSGKKEGCSRPGRQRSAAVCGQGAPGCCRCGAEIWPGGARAGTAPAAPVGFSPSDSPLPAFPHLEPPGRPHAWVRARCRHPRCLPWARTPRGCRSLAPQSCPPPRDQAPSAPPGPGSRVGMQFPGGTGCGGVLLGATFRKKGC